MIDFVWFCICVIFWILSMVLKFLWFIFSTFYPVIILGVLVGFPLYLLIRSSKKPIEKKYRLTPQDPILYYNQFGVLTMVKSDQDTETKIRDHFREADLTERNFRGKS